MAYTHRQESPNLLNVDHVLPQHYNYQSHPLVDHKSLASTYKNDSLVHDASDAQSMFHHRQMANQHYLSASLTHALGTMNTSSSLHYNTHYEIQPILTCPPSLQSTANEMESQYSMSSSSNSSNCIPSSPTASLPALTSNLRFEIYIEAPTAYAQRADESPLTYLNKGQYYAINLHDNDLHDGNITSTFRIMFHDEQHRNVASNYWKFWLGQQANPKLARAFDIDFDKSVAAGVGNIQLKSFDRVSFQWNGREGSQIFIRFNCLSTDFSRIKGVKGIPLRMHMKSNIDGQQQYSERSFCKIKLFRDKGAERKNKDDQKHLEKQLEKMRDKNCEAHPLWLMYAQAHAVSMFIEVPACESELTDEEDYYINLSDDLAIMDSDADASFEKRIRKFEQNNCAEIRDLLDVDPTYEPQPRKKKAVLCLYCRLNDKPTYWAIYLQQLTNADLGAKLLDKLDLQHVTIGNIVRVNKKGLSIAVDDSLIAAMEDEQEMDIECHFQDNGILDIFLRY